MNNKHLKIIFIGFFFLFSYQIIYAQYEVLQMDIKLNDKNNEVKISGYFNSLESKEITISNVDNLFQKFNEVYQILNHRKIFKSNKYKKNIKFLSEKILVPFESYLENCNKIEITIDTTLLNWPIEFLEYKGNPISTLKSISFKWEAGNSFSEKINISTGIIISDKTADPERACITVNNYFPGTAYYSMEDIKIDSIEDGEFDLLLISAHGFTNDKRRGGIILNNKFLTSDKLQKLNPKITYFDACDQGVNLNYIEALLQNNRKNYYLAPIIHNDAGDSSTKTIEGFFSRIKNNQFPDRALFETKKNLYDFYARKIRIVRLNKSLCFRLYTL